ncbi:MAG: double-stranded uracil-DNA glycosylase [Pseudonocardiales bacterium]|jgi:TDG/mug DNA glycosylase family protein|nr:double-stranded uracil-DNA glycosylase [Pseudonocardiales bacterium]
MALPDHLGPGLRVVLAGVVNAAGPVQHEHYYAGPGSRFWLLLRESGLVDEPLGPADDVRVTEFGVGLTDLVRWLDDAPGREPIVRYEVDAFRAKIAAVQPGVVAFVSKTAAAAYARAAHERTPHGYGPVSWTVAGRPAFVLPGPSGANNGMPLPLRIALWGDLADYLEQLN